MRLAAGKLHRGRGIAEAQLGARADEGLAFTMSSLATISRHHQTRAEAPPAVGTAGR
jgi:hypothetical protein